MRQSVYQSRPKVSLHSAQNFLLYRTRRPSSCLFNPPDDSGYSSTQSFVTAARYFRTKSQTFRRSCSKTHIIILYCTQKGLTRALVHNKIITPEISSRMFMLSWHIIQMCRIYQISRRIAKKKNCSPKTQAPKYHEIQNIKCP